MDHEIVTSVRLLPGRLVNAALRQLDGAYFLAQAVVKGLGLQTLTRELPPEILTPEGQRLAVLRNAPGRWPRLHVPLPLGTLFHVSAESLLQRSALWIAPGPVGEVEDYFRAELGRYFVGVRYGTRGGTRVLYVTPLTQSSEADDVVSTINIVVNQYGLVMIGVRQERSPSRRTRRLMQRAEAWPPAETQVDQPALREVNGSTLPHLER